MESEDDQVYIPQVKAELMPKLHQEFETIDEVATFYNRYTKEAGFSIRSHSSATNKDNTQLMRKEYVCYKQGTSKVQGEKCKKGLPQVGCKARIAVVRKESGRYAISVFVEGHNHPLTSPPRGHLLRSHHRVSKVNTVLSQQLSLEFLKGMPGNAPENAPKMIITDKDPAMTKAISEALPQTFHRYCSWHILNKFSEKLDAIKYRDYYQDFYSCIWNSSSTEEFDSRWTEIIEKSRLSDNKWLQSIYEIRSSWIPAHFERGLLHQRYHELEKDHINIDEKARTVMSLDIEDHMAKIYARKIFYEVQEQLRESFKYKLELLRENVTHCVFKVMRKNLDTMKSRELTYEKDSDFASCSCRKFESEGLSCSHVFSYLIKIQDVDKLPTQYILKRWTKDARQSLVLDSDGMEIKDNKALLARRTKLLQHATNAIDKAMVSEEASQLFMKSLDAFLENIKTLIGNESQQNVVVLETKVDNVQHIFNEPDQVRAKGCGRRLKKGKEKRKVKVKDSQGRQCHGCGLFGQSHDKRNCPTLHGKPAINKDGESSSTNMDEESSSTCSL
ncbi:protein FAR1-RELATED SEQUENCE 5-like [Rosa chinensis]|uniref:protein FAR1-RELATED SEQUENCE 5-like n=1 Tax=Rosa chinensis TaxID=74649 RepID=UPI000D0867CE|nr:protein FAR1-RELATED SEQUENCE 5-like [Rosa chinensis]